MYVNADSVYIEEIPSSVAKKMIMKNQVSNNFSDDKKITAANNVGS